MPNVSKIAGLSPVGYLGGAKYDGKGRIYAIPSTDATNNYFIGDLVSLVAGGTAGGSTVTGIPYVSLTAAGAMAVGVVMGVGTQPNQIAIAGGPYINPNDLSKTYAPVTKGQDYYCLVADDPNIVFEVQEGGTGTNLTAAVIGRNANILLGASATAAAPTNFVSGTVLTNSATPAVTNTLNLKILSFAQRPDNRFYTVPATGGAGQKWWVLINNHSYRAINAAI